MLVALITVVAVGDSHGGRHHPSTRCSPGKRLLPATSHALRARCCHRDGGGRSHHPRCRPDAFRTQLTAATALAGLALATRVPTDVTLPVALARGPLGLALMLSGWLFGVWWQVDVQSRWPRSTRFSACVRLWLPSSSARSPAAPWPWCRTRRAGAAWYHHGPHGAARDGFGGGKGGNRRGRAAHKICLWRRHSAAGPGVQPLGLEV